MMADFRTIYARSLWLPLALLLAPSVATPARAQQFDVPFVPTPQVVVDEMLRLAKIGRGDFVFGIGCGVWGFPHAAP